MKMKRNSKFIMLGVIALTGVTAFTSCSSDESAPVNPTFDGESVKTQFSISLPGNVAKTRMAGSTVQVAEDISTFRGMQDIVLIPYAHATNRANRLGTNIVLAENKLVVPSTTNAANAIPSGSSGLLTDNNAVLYTDVTIPVGTSAFLFYGKATGTDGYPQGSLTTEGLTGESSEIFFNPTPIQTEFNSTKGTALATYVNNIAAAKAGDGTNDAAWWKCTDAATYGATGSNPQTWYSAALGDLYRSFISLKPGASSYVQAAVQDLYTTLLPNTDAVSTAIKNAIKDGTNAKDENNDGKLEFQEVINNYPGGEYNSMPDGCASLTWSNVPAANVAATQAATATAKNESDFGGGLTNVQAMSKVAYPASLYYYVDSPVKTSVTSRKDDYVSTNTWATILGKYEQGTSVASTTRSVAITNPIQYAVGRLDLTVKKLDGTTYYDRRGEAVSIPTEGFQLTGVLIGGQKKVDYKFNQVSTADEYAIYDKTINTESASAYVTTTAAAGPNYTLALETAAEQDVYVVLEFLNAGTNAADFQGVDGVVKKGCKFYMVALLVPDADVTDKVSGSANTGKKVFAQDYKTIANFTFGLGTQDLHTNGTTDGHPDGVADTPGGFANAYVTIPDLRTPQLELGMSVNLNWKAGITFEHTF